MAIASFIVYLVLLCLARKEEFKRLLEFSLYCFVYYVGAAALIFAFNWITNFVFFGDPLSPLEEQLDWIPILRSPLIEEGSKFVAIFALKRMQKVSGNALVRLGGVIGNWYFLLENLVYIFQGKISLLWMPLRLFPMHMSSALLGGYTLKKAFSRKRLIFLALAMLLHGVHNFLSIYYFPQLYVLFGFVVSLPLFFVILKMTPVHAIERLSPK